MWAIYTAGEGRGGGYTGGVSEGYILHVPIAARRPAEEETGSSTAHLVIG